MKDNQMTAAQTKHSRPVAGFIKFGPWDGDEGNRDDKHFLCPECVAYVWDYAAVYPEDVSGTGCVCEDCSCKL